MTISKKLILPFAISSLLVTQMASADGKMENMAENAERKTEQAYESAKNKTGEAWQDVKEGSKETWSDVKHGSKKAWKNTQTAFDNGVKSGKIETALILNKHLNPFEIDIDVEGNKVTLTGEVDSEIEKELAANIAKGVEGITDVDNKIVVEKNSKKRQANTSGTQRDFSQYVEDASTTASIKVELLANDNIEGMDINVDTFNDRVTLSGTVKSEAQKSLAEAIVKKREGVEAVVNRLKVNS